MNIADRFWSKVDRREPDECWPWTGSTSSAGYGQFKAEGRNCATHRLAWVLTSGEIPAGLLVCHRCDNRPCCNPAHLFLGTYADNGADMAAKGRSLRGDRSPARLMPERMPRGERHGCAVLSARDVSDLRTLRESGLTFDELAANFGISRSQAHRIVHGQSWAHLPDPIAGPPIPKVVEKGGRS